MTSVAPGGAIAPGWTRSTLGEIGEYLNGRAFKKEEWSSQGRVIIRIQDLTGSRERPNRFRGTVDPRYEVTRGDLLISWAATLGVYWWMGEDAVLNQHIFKVNSFVDPRFHYYLAGYVVDDLYRLAHGSGMVHITKSRFESTVVPIPPLLEQRRIVAAIEERLSRLEAAVAALKRVQALIPRYRAAVLKAAVEGRLIPQTADWQAASVADLASKVEYGTSARAAPEGDVPVLRMGNIVDGRLRFESLKYLPKKHDEFPRLLLEPGDVLFNRTNSPELVGKTAVYHGQPHPCSFASYLIRVRLRAACLPEYLAAFLNSVHGRTWIADVVSQQVGQANVSGGKLKALRVPLPPISEQRQIASEIERRLSLAEAVGQEVGAALLRAGHLRQSILKRAFEGKLVAQDPSDEPASVLLARIRASRGEPAPRKRRPRQSA